MSDNKMNGKDFVIGTLLGGLLGAMGALLLARKPGKELRGDISEQYREINQKTRELASSVGQKTQDAAAQVSSVTTELTGKVIELAGNMKDGVQSCVREAQKESAATLDAVVSGLIEDSNDDEPTKS